MNTKILLHRNRDARTNSSRDTVVLHLSIPGHLQLKDGKTLEGRLLLFSSSPVQNLQVLTSAKARLQWVTNKVRFRNQISTLPQPNFDDSATKIRYASATKKWRFRNQKKKIPQPKKDDSETKTKRFRNQKLTIPQPKSARFGNQNPRHFATKICASTLCMASSPSATLNMASSSDAVGAAAFPPQHTCCHTQHGIVFRCGGVGWGGVGQ